jgi:hypothetical protein
MDKGDNSTKTNERCEAGKHQRCALILCFKPYGERDSSRKKRMIRRKTGVIEKERTSLNSQYLEGSLE